VQAQKSAHSARRRTKRGGAERLTTHKAARTRANGAGKGAKRDVMAPGVADTGARETNIEERFKKKKRAWARKRKKSEDKIGGSKRKTQ